MMTTEYELTSILDIYEKVPTDRIQDCCRELGLILAQTKAFADLVGALVDENAPPPVTLFFPLVWKDDDKGEVVTTLETGDGEILRMETAMAALSAGEKL